MGFNFGPQRIRDFAIMSVVSAFTQIKVSTICNQKMSFISFFSIHVAYWIIFQFYRMKKGLIILGWKIAILIILNELRSLMIEHSVLLLRLCIFVKFILLTGFRNYFQELFNYAVFINIAKLWHLEIIKDIFFSIIYNFQVR